MKLRDDITDIRNSLVSIAKSQERISGMIARLVNQLEKKIK
jgi:hypothetical protein